MGKARNRGQVMLAERLERDVPKRDDFIVTGRLVEGALQHRLGIFIVTFEPFLVGAGYPGSVSLRPCRPGSSPAQARSVRTASSTCFCEGLSFWIFWPRDLLNDIAEYIDAARVPLLSSKVM